MHNSLSIKLYNASLMWMIYLHTIEPSRSFPVIFYSGVTLAISPSEEDWVGPIAPFQIDRRLGGMAGDMHISGIGSIEWSFRVGKKLLAAHSMCYYVPNSTAWFISP